jgi:hypothetical protein
MSYGGPKTLGGGFQGIAPKQTITNYKSSEETMTRRVLRDAWNTQYATGVVNGRNRIITPFRAVTNSGDFLSRKNYQCGGPNPITADRYKRKNNMGSIFYHCDGTGVQASSCNVKFVADSSDYTTYRRQRAVNSNYNDNSFGGDQHNASYVPLLGVRRK